MKTPCALAVVDQNAVGQEAAQRRLELMVVRVDEARHDDHARGIDDLGVGGIEARADRGDAAAFDEHVRVAKSPTCGSMLSTAPPLIRSRRPGVPVPWGKSIAGSREACRRLESPDISASSLSYTSSGGLERSWTGGRSERRNRIVALIDPIWQFCNRSLKRALSWRLAPTECDSRKALAGRIEKPEHRQDHEGGSHAEIDPSSRLRRRTGDLRRPRRGARGDHTDGGGRANRSAR